MTLTMMEATIPPLTAMLTNMRSWLDKAGGLAPEADLLDARIAPDMYPLAQQYRIASDIAKGGVARLCGLEAPAMADDESSIADLRSRMDRTLDFIRSTPPGAFDGSETRAISLSFPNGMRMDFDGKTYLTGFVLPNIHFHASIAYALLRGRGAALGKADFLAHLAPHITMTEPAA